MKINFKSKKFIITSIALSTISLSAVAGISAGVISYKKGFDVTKLLDPVARFLNSIKKSDIVVYKLGNSQIDPSSFLPSTNDNLFQNANSNINRNETIANSENYAFNVIKEQLGFRNDFLIPDSTAVSIELNQKLNTTSSLNNGFLYVDIFANRINQEVRTKTIELNDFKKAHSDLTSFLNSSDQEGLIINPKIANSLMSIEQLNDSNWNNTNTSGINVMFKTAYANNELINQVQLDAKVQLKKIIKQNAIVYFVLEALDKNEPIKLTRVVNNEIQQAAVKQIYFSNLAASSITLLPIQANNEAANNLFKQALLATNANNENLEVLSKETNIQISIKNPSSIDLANPNVIITNINPYVITKQTNEINFTFSIRYGQKIYWYNNIKDYEELVNADFVFSIYLKDLKTSDLNVSSLELSSSELGLFKHLNNQYIPINKTLLGSYNYKETEIKTISDLNKVNIVNDHKNETENYIGFISYKFNNIPINQVLFTPDLSIIRMQK